MSALNILWAWCPVCEVTTAICPTCGTNSCGAGRGVVNGEPCKDCVLTWEEEKKAHKQNRAPLLMELESIIGETELNMWEEQVRHIPVRKCTKS